MTLFRRIATDGCMLSGKCLKGVPYIYLNSIEIYCLNFPPHDRPQTAMHLVQRASVLENALAIYRRLYVTGILRQRLTFGLIDLQPIAYRKCTFFNVFLLPYFSLLANSRQEE